MENLKLKFRNNRNYVHGTDIFNLLVKKKSYNLIDLKFKKPLRYMPILIDPKKNKNIAVDCMLKKRNKKKFFIVNSKRKIKERYFVDENIPSNNISLSKNSIKCDFKTKLTPIEVLVSLTNIFHKKKIGKTKKWFFTRIILNKNFNYNLRKKFKIKIDQNYRNKSTVSKVYEYNRIIGLINFTSKW